MPSSDALGPGNGLSGGGSRAGSGGERRVLIVSNEAALIHSLRLVLEGDNYQTLAASDGLEALRRVRQGLPDLIIVDDGLPEFDTPEFVREVREVSLVPLLVLLQRLESATIIRL